MSSCLPRMKWPTRCSLLLDIVRMESVHCYGNSIIENPKMKWSHKVSTGNMVDPGISTCKFWWIIITFSRELLNTSEVIKFTQKTGMRRYNSLTTNYINSKLLLYIRISRFLPHPKTKKQSRFNDHFNWIYTIFVLCIIIV